MIAPTGADPVKKGDESEVLLSVVDEPVSEAGSRSGVETLGMA
jgi:hypothetical protein